MSEIVLNSLDIFFVIMMAMLYIAFVFLAKNITSKFFIFFISSFVNIFNYSVVLKDQYSFLTVVLLNIIFMLIVIIFFIYSNLEKENLPSSFIESNDIKNLIIIVIFLTSFIILCFIFTSINKQKDLFKGGTLNGNHILTTTKIYYKEKNIQRKEIFENNGQKFIIYNRNIDFIEKNNIFTNYNLFIVLYVSIVIVVFFATNKTRVKNER